LRVSDYIFIVCKGEIVFESVPQGLKNNEEIKSRYLCASK